MPRLRRQLAVAVFAVVCASCAKPPATAAIQPEPATKKNKPSETPPEVKKRGKVSSISMEDFFALHSSGQALVFDTRPAFIYHLGHIPGAVHLPRTGGDAAIQQQETAIKSALDAGKRIVAYCSGPSCPDAHTVAVHISGFGYPVSVFSGGWNAWQAADLPTE